MQKKGGPIEPRSPLRVLVSSRENSCSSGMSVHSETSKSPIPMDAEETSPATAGITDLPYEILRQIFSYLTDKDIFWGLGMTNRRLMTYALDWVSTIEMPRKPDRVTLKLLKGMLQHIEMAEWIQHVVMLGDFSKSLLDQTLRELKGNTQKCLA